MIKSGIAAPGYTGGAGATPSWNDVMTVGNTSNRDAVVNNSVGQSIVRFGDALGFNGGGWAITNPGNANPVNLAVGTGIFGYVLPGGGIYSNVLGFWNQAAGGVETTYLIARLNTARRRIYLTDDTGNILLGNRGIYTAAATLGQTVITIPHGMWPSPDIFIAPSNSIINATDAATAAVLVGGYFMTYDTTNMYVHLLVPVVGTPTLNITWTAIV